MIRLLRPPKPTHLTSEVEERLLATYQSSGDSVWNKDYIREPLLQASHNKCAYCETEFLAGQIMEIDHFDPKQVSPEKAMTWENFVPSCGRCNGTKSFHNIIAEPIINPFSDDPRDHLSLKIGRLKSNTSLGSMTIEVLDLNDRDLSLARGKITMEVDEKVDELLVVLNNIGDPVEPNIKRSITRKATAILRGGTSIRPYTATVATFLGHDREWSQAKDMLLSLKLWTPLMESLESEMLSYVFPAK